MTREEAVNILKDWDGYFIGHSSDDVYNALDMAIKALEQQPCDDCISRQAVIDAIDKWVKSMHVLTALPANEVTPLFESVHELSSVIPQQKMGRCKDCKYFEYDSVAKVNGIPLIVAHEICERWGNGCKSKEDGYCFLFEPKMQEVEENEKT